jgi:DNA-binding beta-propeller fold protein YncE
MTRFAMLCGGAVVLAVAATAATVRADHPESTVVVTMTNDPVANQIRVYDAATGALLQTAATRGKGGAGGNARGVREYQGELVAAVNNGSNSVSLFRRNGNELKLEQLVTTTSAPVSVDFGNDHMYVAGATTVDSFVMNRNHVEWMDGTTLLELAAGGVPPAGSTAQVGVIDGRRLLVTLKTDPDPGTVDVVALRDGAVIGSAPRAVSAPPGTLTPFGFVVNPDGTAVITLAHSSQVGLFRDGAFASVIAATQTADCWATRIGKYVITANTGSATLSRFVSTGSHVFVDSSVAAVVPSGGAPSDIDAQNGVLGVIDHSTGESHLTLWTYNGFGELAASGRPIVLGVPNANGIAILPPPHDGRR